MNKFPKIINSRSVRIADSAGGSGFNGHVTACHASFHAHGIDYRPRKFNDFIGSAIYSDTSDNRKNHIFGIDTFGQASGDDDLYGMGIVKGTYAFENADFQIGCSHACCKGPKSAMCTGVGISHDDGIAWSDKAFFREKRMTNAISADIKKIRNAMTMGPVPKNLALKRCLGIFGR